MRNEFLWPAYKTVAQRKAKAERQAHKLKKKGMELKPVAITGRKIARNFWGEAWCRHLESLSDYSNRLPRGRSYVRHGQLIHLDIEPGHVKALVSGNDIYTVTISIRPLHRDMWRSMCDYCSGHIGSVLELLQGRLSNEVMALVTNRSDGLFPLADEIEFDCDCPDWASMCKHVAAVLYGVGARLDKQPELLFTLRDVDAKELIQTEIDLSPLGSDSEFAEDDLSEIFGIEIDSETDVSDESNVSNESDIIVEKSDDFDHELKPVKGYPIDNNGLIIFTGAMIRALREEHGLTRKAFAKLIRSSASRVGQWERAPERLPKLALWERVELETLVKFGI